MDKRERHSLTGEDLDLNPQLRERGLKEGDEVDEGELVNRPIPVAESVGTEAEEAVNPKGTASEALRQPMVWDNNKVNVTLNGQVVRTFSGEVDGQNWKKLAEMYAHGIGGELAQYSSEVTQPINDKDDNEQESTGRKRGRPARAAAAGSPGAAADKATGQRVGRGPKGPQGRKGKAGRVPRQV